MSEDSINLPSPEDIIREGIKQICRLRKRLILLGQTHVFGGLSVTVALIIFEVASDVPDVISRVVVSLGVGGAAAGALMWISSLQLRSQRTYYHASKLDAEQQREGIKRDVAELLTATEIEHLRRHHRLLKVVESVDLYVNRLPGVFLAALDTAVAQILQQLASLNEAREADRKAFIEKLLTMDAQRAADHAVILQRLASMEEQRLADLDMLRDNAEKRFEGIHDRLDAVDKRCLETSRTVASLSEQLADDRAEVERRRREQADRIEEALAAQRIGGLETKLDALARLAYAMAVAVGRMQRGEHDELDEAPRPPAKKGDVAGDFAAYLQALDDFRRREDGQ